MKVQIRSAEHGDQVLELTPPEVLEEIEAHEKKNLFGYMKFSDGEILDMMDRSGILEQLERKEAAGVSAKLVPLTGGG